MTLEHSPSGQVKAMFTIWLKNAMVCMTKLWKRPVYGTPNLPDRFIYFLFVVLKWPVVLHKREFVMYKKQVVKYIYKVVLVELKVAM